eukprot:763667-Hanusia_phi.AAC.2
MSYYEYAKNISAHEIQDDYKFLDGLCASYVRRLLEKVSTEPHLNSDKLSLYIQEITDTNLIELFLERNAQKKDSMFYSCRKIFEIMEKKIKIVERYPSQREISPGLIQMILKLLIVGQVIVNHCNSDKDRGDHHLPVLSNLLIQRITDTKSKASTATKRKLGH